MLIAHHSKRELAGAPCFLLRLGLAGAALALTILALTVAVEAAVPPELPFTSRSGVGARPMGMAGAYTALADDYHALYYNPAGLTRIRDAQFGLAFDSRSADANTSYLGSSQSTSADKTRLGSIGFAYPYPTYRGSLAIALSYERIAPFDIDYFRSGSGGNVVSEAESIEEHGSLGSYLAGFAWELSPTLALGVTGSLITGSSDRRRTFDYEGGNGIDRERTTTETTTDISAISGSLGLLYRFGERGDFGLLVRLPEKFDLDGTIHDDVIRYQQSPTDTLDFIDDFDFTDELTLPFSVTGGIAYRAGSFAFSGDVTFADWKEIDYFGPVRTDDRRFAYRSTVDLRFGVELAIPEQPVRLRAGYASQPVPYDVVAVDVFRGETRPARFDHDRRFFTVGAGIDLDESFVIDGAYVTGSFRRLASSSNGVTEEEVEERRLILGATFRVKT